MASKMPPGLFLSSFECAVLDSLLMRALADMHRRDDVVPERIAELAAHIHQAAREFRATQQVRDVRGTTEQRSGSVTRVSGATERLSAREAAQLGHVSEELVRRLARQGVLVGNQVGPRGAWLLDPNSVAVWIAERSDRMAA